MTTLIYKALSLLKGYSGKTKQNGNGNGNNTSVFNICSQTSTTLHARALDS